MNVYNVFAHASIVFAFGNYLVYGDAKTRMKEFYTKILLHHAVTTWRNVFQKRIMMVEGGASRSFRLSSKAS